MLEKNIKYKLEKLFWYKYVEKKLEFPYIALGAVAGWAPWRRLCVGAKREREKEEYMKNKKKTN